MGNRSHLNDLLTAVWTAVLATAGAAAEAAGGDVATLGFIESKEEGKDK